MVKKSVKNLVHRDQKEYIKRVQTAGGLISDNSQIGLNRFIKFHYSKGLRDTKNINHLVQHCSVYATETITGSNHNLWFLDGKKTHYFGSDNAYTYEKNRGVTLLSNSRIDTDIAPSLLNLNDFSLGYFCTRINEATGYFGSVSGTFPTDVRLYSHPQYTNTRGIYFDSGNDVNARRTVGTISPTDDDKNNKGLTICTKNNNVGLIQHKYSLRATSSNLATNSPAPTTFMEHFAGSGVTDRLDFGGYWYGKNIDQSLFEPLVDEWEILQTSINPSRSQTSELSPDNFMGLESWFDAKDSSSLVFTNGNNVSGWNDKSGNGKNLTSSISGRTVIYNGSDGLNMLGDEGQTAMSRADGFYMGCVAIIFTPTVSVNNSFGENNNRYIFGSMLATTTEFWSGIALGSSTSNLSNEVLTFLYASNARVGYTQNFTFNANQKYLILFNRNSDTNWKIYINRNSFFPTTNQTNLGTQVNNKNLFIGTRWNNSNPLIGIIHEFCNFRNGLAETDLNLLVNYLCDANGIP